MCLEHEIPNGISVMLVVMVTRFCAATLLLTLLVACGDDAASTSDQPAPTSAAPPSPTKSATSTTTPTTSEPAATASASASAKPEVTKPTKPSKPGKRIVQGASDFGPMLFDGTGQAIYLFDVETSSQPACYDACAAAWPPVLTQGKPVAGTGIDGSLLSTTRRADGSTQVTYNDHPLYFYAHEAQGEVKCHDIFLNGGNWYVVRPGGEAAPPG